MGFSSRSRSTSTTETDVKNINLQDVSGTTFAGVDGDIIFTDQGSLDVARDIALAGLDTGRTGFSEVLDLAGSVLAGGRAQNETIAGIASDIAARESGNVDARLENITRVIAIGGVVVVVVFFFTNRNKR